MSAECPVAVVGNRLYTGLRDLTTDLTALDSQGQWVLVLTFEGAPTCARFERVDLAPTRLAPKRRWAGPDRHGWTTSIDRDDFSKGVVRIRSAIAAGDVYQVNLCRVLTAPADSPDEVLALSDALAAGNPAPHAATVHLPAVGVHVASASPELFLARHGERITSRPIKGTATCPDGFLAKDRAENVMIVDLVRNDLGRVCEFGSVTVPALCAVEPHPGLLHLVSTVDGRLRAGVGWADLLTATFPPGSVVGAPKLAALDVIAGLEPVQRGPYCGTVGWVDADAHQGELNVAIRTFWWAEGQWHLGTGAGITWDSTAAGEWDETELKASNLLAVAAGSTVGAP
jgi:para-aminobenzoate synthetase component 1